jgi:hypothetical protein
MGRWGYSFINLRDAGILEDPRTNTLREHLGSADPRVADFIAKNNPLGTVRLISVAPALADEYNLTKSGLIELTIAESPIYDLSPIGQVMRVTVGRYLENLLGPMCVFGLESDRTVSREHGAVFVKDGTIFYRDIGTHHTGSTNGTQVNSQTEIVNKTIVWKPGDYLGIGCTVSDVAQSSDDDTEVFKLRFVPASSGKAVEDYMPETGDIKRLKKGENK